MRSIKQNIEKLKQEIIDIRQLDKQREVCNISKKLDDIIKNHMDAYKKDVIKK